MAKFESGKSGNYLGRPKGIQDKRTTFNKLLEPHADALIAKAVELALDGDTCALRLCIERLIPKIRGEAVNISLTHNDIKNIETLLNSNAEIIKAAAIGEITLEQAQMFSTLLETQHKFIVDTELGKRMAAIEAVLKLKKEEQKE